MKDPNQIARIRKLAIPPAYTDVWICPDPRGHIQATGRDARGRRQYRYHPRWRGVRDEAKFTRLPAFAEALPKMRAAKVLATVVRLLEWTCIRVGNEEYARSNKTFGLTTLKDQHVEVNGSKVRFEFRGKSGKVHACDVSDRRVARIVAHCQSIPGQAIDRVSRQLNNTRAVCLLDRYERELKRARARGLEKEEAAVLAILQARMRLAA